MIAHEIIDALKSASASEIAQIRSLLRIPVGDYQRHDVDSKEMPRDLADVWNRHDTAGVPIKTKQE